MPSQPQAQLFDVPALLVEARFRGRPLASRLLRAGESRAFAVGAARGADAPVDAAFVLGTPGNDNHVLVQPSAAGFLINLSPQMRTCSEETTSHLRVACGAVVFDLHAAATTPAIPRPWLSARAKDLVPYLGGVAVAMTFLLVMIQMVPSDPHALSLDDLGRSARLDIYRIKPPLVAPPPPIVGRGPAGAGPQTAASGPKGTAGDHHARRANASRATKGQALYTDPRAVEAYVRSTTMLAVLDGARSQAFTRILSATTSALGSNAETVLAHLEGQSLANAYGTGLGPTGTGKGNADTGRPLIGGVPSLGTLGRRGSKAGGERGYGDSVGALPPRDRVKLTMIPAETVVRGGLDKEIVRRVVRQHLNEVRYCYEQSLLRRPSLAGRVVANFTIAPTGRVLASLVQSSTLGEAAVDACIVAAVRRWDFPRPEGGGVVVVSYPFQLAPAGG